MGDGALGSDHINYLILRYLQEAGHENAARALHKDWNRPDEYNDPEQLPFASQVKQFDLVKIIQDGLFHDQLQAEVTKQLPRFSLIQKQQAQITPRPAQRAVSSEQAEQTSNRTIPQQSRSQDQHQQKSQQDQQEEAQQEHDADLRQAPLQTSRQSSNHNQSSVSRQSSNHTHSRSQHHDSDDFPLPAPKRVRKSNGDEASILSQPSPLPLAQVNGDAMEVDMKTPLTLADDGRSDDVDADRAMSEAIDHSSPVQPATETISAGTQTDVKLKIRKSETIYWSIEKEDANIVNAIWNPKPGNARGMLVVGDSVCRFYQVPQGSQQHLNSNGDSSHDNVVSVAKDARNAFHMGTNHFDVQDMPKGSTATAACWHPSGNYATCSLDLRRQINGSQDAVRCLFDTRGQTAGPKRTYSDNAYINLLQRQSTTLTTALRWNSEGSLLATVSMSTKRGLLEIWRDPSEEPIAVKIFSRSVFDAVWASNDEIIVCGQGCLESYKIHLPHTNGGPVTNGNSSALSDSFTTTGARNLSLQHSYSTNSTWEKVRYDVLHNVVAAVSTLDDSIIILGRPELSSSRENQWTPLPGFPTKPSSTSGVSALAFEHEPTNTKTDMSQQPRRLAVTHHSGIVNIYAITSDSCSLQQTLDLNSDGRVPEKEAALALSWSPDGELLAVASERGICVWSVTSPSSSSFSTPQLLQQQTQFPVLNWKANPVYWAQSPDGENGAGGRGSENDADADGDEMMDEGEDVQMVNEPALAWDAEGSSLVFALGRRMAVVRLLS